MLKNRQSYIVGAAIISMGGFIAKLLGALYRIPLLNFLGGGGMGIYQMVYPLYCILLTVSSSGIPAGVARLIASGRGAGAEKRALTLYGGIGAIGSLIMFASADVLAFAVGEPAAAPCCRALSPAVFCVSVISVVRGYFQGNGNMLPTAITEISEQLIKVVTGSVVAYSLRENVTAAVTGAVLAVTISEAASAAIAMRLYYKKRGTQPMFRERQADARSIFAYTVPLTFTALAMPLSQFIESIVAVRLLKEVTDSAVSLYGIFSGCAVTVVNMPAALTYGFAAAGIPAVSPKAANGDMAGAKKKCAGILLITLAVSVPCALALYAFAPLAAGIIFRSLSDGERTLLVSLIRIMSVNAVTLSIVQTSSACLTALGSPAKSAASQWISAAARVAVTAVLIKFASLSVTGAAISANCSYLLAVLLNICYIISTEGRYESDACRSGNGRKRYIFGRKKGA